MSKVLVTGGAGYIGSHTVKILRERGYDVLVFDSLENGYRQALLGAPLVKADLGNQKALDRVFREHKIDAVIHFAAYASVPDSVANPQRYFDNNITNGLNLINAMVRHKVKYLVFSSSAAVYGEPKSIPIIEDAPKESTNPYGLTKWQFEQILRWYDKAYGLRSISLRYFCAAGADPEGKIGEAHEPEHHLIPLVLKTALGQRESISIFGTDYDTPDGTCIRDFIHILDLADAHIKSISALQSGHQTDYYNLGSEQGYSVREVIAMGEKVSGKKIKTVEDDQRPGDPARLVASSKKFQKDLKWKPKYQDLRQIMETAYHWHKRQKFGNRK